MGLAASQARFLGITARKNACELRSMEIAQERLSVSNQLSQASQNYMTSLNATKLVWNPERTDDFIYQVDYPSLTRPSNNNDYQLQLLTNIKGQVVLGTSMYDALFNGTGAPTFTPETVYNDPDGNPLPPDFTHGNIARTTDNFLLFIDALNAQGIISNADTEQIHNAIQHQIRYPISTDPDDGTAYTKYNGFGKNLANIAEVYSTDLMGLCDYVDDITDMAYEEDGYLTNLFNTYGSNPLAPTPYDMAADVVSYLNFDNFLDNVQIRQNTYNEYNNSQRISVVKNAATPQDATDYIYHSLKGDDDNYENWTSVEAFNFADAMGTNDLALVAFAHEGGGYGGNIAAFEKVYVEQIDNFVNNLENIAKYFFEYNGDTDEEALIRTRTVIESLYKEANGSLRTTDANYEHPEGSQTYMGGVPDYMNYCIPVEQVGNYNGGENNLKVYAFSLSNLAQAFFTEYENQRSVATSGYEIATSTGFVGDCNLVTMDEYYTYDYIDAGTTNPDGQITQILNYYSQMFNQICVKGYTYNPAADDPEKLQNMIKNGSLAISSIKDDNYFYQYDYEAYSVNGGYFMEVADEDAITEAEAEYKVKQAQLNAKEEELSVDMQNIEAELAALTTEYDTVKNLINKSVQKDFTTCGG